MEDGCECVIINLQVASWNWIRTFLICCRFVGANIRIRMKHMEFKTENNQRVQFKLYLFLKY